MSSHASHAQSPSKDETGDSAGFLRLLSSFVSGNLTVSVNNFPFVKIDGETKTLDVEIKGLEQSGLKMGSFIQSGTSKGNFLDTIRQSSGMAHRLHNEGWSIRVFEGESSLLKVGRGVSPMTGFVWVNPLKIPRLMRLI
jgi:hypothetical protein